MTIEELEKILKQEELLTSPLPDGSIVKYMKLAYNVIPLPSSVNSYGIYKRGKQYHIFFTDEMGASMLNETYISEDEACQELLKTLRKYRRGYKVYLQKQIKELLTNDYNYSPAMAEKACDKLMQYYDIANEFYQVSENDFPSYEPIHVENYTAEKLYDNYHLSILGAYNYLIYLREHPKEALHDLKLGLPRR